MEHLKNDRWQEAVQHLLAVHRPEQAEQLARRRLASHPEEAAAYRQVALALLNQKGRESEAGSLIKQAIALDPQHSDGHYFHSVSLLHSGQPFASLEAIGEALRLDAFNATYHGHKAIILNTRRQYSEALMSAQAGLSYDPSHVECLFQCIQALRHLQKPDAAALTIRQLLRWHPTLALAHFVQGEEELRKSRLTAAERQFREAMRLAPSDTRARKKLLPLLITLGQQAQARTDVAKARAYFLEAWQLDPTNQEARQGIEQLAQSTFWLKRHFIRFDAWSEEIQKQASQGQWQGWVRLLLVLCPIVCLGCVPLILLYSYAAVQWRLHPDVQMLNRYTSFKQLAWRVFLVLVLGVGALALIIWFRLWLETQSGKDIAVLLLLLTFIVALCVWQSRKQSTTFL